jgi:AraC family transcriptional regulator
MRIHAGGGLTLGRIAREAGSSPYHFAHMYQALTGETPFAFVTRTRLSQAAARLMEDGRLPVTAIALEAGYETPSAFNKAFRAALGISPTGLRKMSPARRAHALRKLDNPRWRIAMHLDVTPEPTIERRPDLLFVYVRRLGRFSEQAPQAWTELRRLLNGSALAEPVSQFIGACWDDAERVAEDALRYDAGFTVARRLDKLPKGLQQAVLPGGKYARFIYKGSYAHMGAAFGQAMRGWMAKSGAVLREGPHLEINLNDPDHTPEKDLLTALLLPIE